AERDVADTGPEVEPGPVRRGAAVAPRLGDRGTGARASERVQGIEALCLCVGPEFVEPISRRSPLPIVLADCLFDGCCPPVVEKPIDLPQTPQRRCPHLFTGRVPLYAAVAEAPHLVEEKVREREERLVAEGPDVVRSRLENGDVAIGTSESGENHSASSDV